MEIRKILWPTDFSKAASAAEAYVIRLSRQHGAEVHMLFDRQRYRPLRPISEMQKAEGAVPFPLRFRSFVHPTSEAQEL